MINHTLLVPSSRESKDWFEFVNSSLNVNHRIDTLTVDFNGVYFLETDDFVILACLIETFYTKGSIITFKGGTDKFNAHLHNIKFKEYWKEGFDRDRFTISLNSTTLCLWKISQEMIYSYSNYANQYFSRFAENKDLTPLSSNIDEVFNNIFDHSQSKISGYIITQYYPKNKKISFSACDFGRGIPKSINDTRIANNEKSIEDWRALSLAIEEGFSIKSSPQNRGLGLNNILTFTENNKGSLAIISNDGVLLKKADGDFKFGTSNFDFSGTLIKVEVDLNSFDQKDDSNEIIDF